MTRDAAETVARLLVHVDGTTSRDGAGFADMTLRHEYAGGVLDLRQTWEDLAEVLTDLVEVVASGGFETVNRKVTYAISDIVTRSTEAALNAPSAEDRHAFAVFAWMVACGWDAVLANDIDDIAEQVRGEAWGRGIPDLQADD